MGLIQVKKDSKFFLDEDFTSSDVSEDIVGRKGVSLFNLQDLDVPVPPFFVISSSVFTQYIANNLDKKMSPDTALSDLQKKIREGDFDAEIKNELLTSYSRLSGFTDAWVAVRSSIVPPIDKRDLSFAGLLDTKLNIKGLDDLVDAIKEVYASVFTEKVAHYLSSNNSSIAGIKVSIVVQKMIQAEASGILFTVDPISQNKDLLMTEAVFGLGDVIAAGEITPDQYVIDKKTLDFKEKKIVPQEWMMVRKIKRQKEDESIQKVQISKAWQHQQKIDNRYLKELAEICIKIEKQMGNPQDVEWVLEGSRLWILQTRNIHETQIKIEDHEQLKVNRDIIEAAQKIAEQEKSRQDIREKLHQQKADKSVMEKEAVDKEKTTDKTEKNQSPASTDNSPQQQTQTPKLGTMQAQLSDTPTSEVSKSKEPTKESEPQEVITDDEENTKDAEAPFVSKPINRQIVKSIPRSQRQPATPHKGEKLILTGIGASTGAARGTVLIVEDENDFEEKKGKITPDTILVIPDYISDIENYLKATTGVICDTGGMTSDIAIIAREMNIPCIMGCGIASKMLENGDELLLDGNVGAIYGQKEKDKGSKMVEQEKQQPTLSELTDNIDVTEEEEQTKEVATATSQDTTEISELLDDTQAGIDLTKDSEESKEEAETASEKSSQTPQADHTAKKSAPQASLTDNKNSATTSASPATKTATKVYVNLANSFARGEKWQDHTQDADGVAVVQIEDIYRRLGKHPNSFIEENNTNELIDEMANELANVCEASKGNPVIASIGSMTVDQYKNLKNGEKYEKWENTDITDNSAGLERLLKRPKELSSMLKAVRRVRNVEGWRNISIAVEFPGSPEELIEFKKILSAGGLRRSSTFLLYIVVDTPSVAMVIEDFIEAGIDGAIINMTSLAKLMRAPDPEDESVLKTMENIRSNWRDGELIVQTPNNPDKIIDKAVQSGIKAISCPPSNANDVRKRAAEKERELVFSN